MSVADFKGTDVLAVDESRLKRRVVSRLFTHVWNLRLLVAQ
jgi:hypothetical protein